MTSIPMYNCTTLSRLVGIEKRKRQSSKMHATISQDCKEIAALRQATQNVE
jgi:hypothetical protein